MKNKNFVAFILTHGRPNKVLTYNTLRKQGYTGDICLIVDNEDSLQDEYIASFDNVYIFNKKEVSKTFEEADNFEDRRAIVYARNVCFEAAKSLGYRYFIQLDDDYTSFRYRYFNDEYTTKGTVKNLDKYLEIMLDFYKSTNINSIAMAQGGDFIGGASCGLLSNYENLSRKAMNSFICSTDRPYQFIGRINEDVNTYTRKGNLGLLQITIPFIALEQLQTQANTGGMTDIYKMNGTYIKSFYSVMFQPSSVKVKLMGFKNSRLHHSVKWENTVPKIISQKHKKQ